MKEADIPLDFSFVMELANPPSLEDELQLEKEIRSIKSCTDIEQVKMYAEDIARQNHQQSIFIAGCLTRVAELQTIVVRTMNKQPKKSTNLLKKILKLE
tara:strand:- start:961 stop:1257 length:297 start_codon:yes stop_codon:yes gene_type:complete